MKQKNSLIIASIFVIIVVMMIGKVTASDTWDRPITQTNITPIVINLTQQLSDLQGQISNETQYRIGNDSILQSQINTHNINITALFNFYYGLNNTVNYINTTIKQPVGIYLQSDATTFQVNSTALNDTIRNISKIQNYAIEYNLTTISGYASVISTEVIGFEIKKVSVNSSTTFRFQLSEYPSGNIIDKDRIPHQNSWIIEKNYPIDSKVNITISNAVVDTVFNVRIDYLNNGVE
jgi:hypothetical protein